MNVWDAAIRAGLRPVAVEVLQVPVKRLLGRPVASVDSFKRECRTWMEAVPEEAALMRERFLGPTMADYDRERDKGLVAQVMDKERLRMVQTRFKARLGNYIHD